MKRTPLKTDPAKVLDFHRRGRRPAPARAMPAERDAPSVDVSLLDPVWREAAEARLDAARDPQAGDLPPEVRLARALAAARERGIDVGRQVASIEQRIASLESKVKRRAA